MKVLGLVTDAFGSKGGIAAVARDLAWALDACDKVEAVRFLPRVANADLGRLPVKTQQFKASAGKFNFATAAMWRALLWQPTIIYCNHLNLTPVAVAAAWLTRSPLVAHLHGIEIWKAPTAMQRRALEAADLLLCVSRDTRAKLLTFCDIAPERAVVLNNTYGSEFRPGDRNAARTKFGLSDEFALLTVGRMAARERYKGHDQILEVLPDLLVDRPNLVYLVAGDGDDRLRLEAKARELGVDSHVRFLGHVDHADLPDLYRAADLYSMPSTGEGFGVAFVEAMACGTPALGFAVAGAKDALVDGVLGMMVEKDGLYDGLVSAIKTPRCDCASLASAVERRFGRSIYARRMGDVLERLAA